MEPTIFTRILNREIPAEIIYEDEYVFVIPDRFPTMHGQLIVITKRQTPYVFDLEKDEYEALMGATQKIAKALDTAFNTARTCMVLEGFEVPHVHVRLYPCTTNELVWNPRYEAPDDELKTVADKVRAALS
jgi:histidine triad (HIT) family protein